jgi:hypothetical protein
LLTNNIVTIDTIANSVLDFLNDYTTDRRGDIGSLIRVEAVQAASILLKQDSQLPPSSPVVQSLLGCLCRLASEKLDKVRLQAWLCLQEYWESVSVDFPPMQR